MSHSLTTATLPPETEALIDAVLAEKVQNNECFFALDVSNEVKERGLKSTPPSGFGRHTDMQGFVFDRMLAFMAAGGYACTDYPFNPSLSIPSRRLYHPLGATQQTIDAHENRKVIPLPPVEVLMAQKSQQATGTQQFMHTTTGAAQPSLGAPVSADPASTPVLGSHIIKQLGGGQ